MANADYKKQAAAYHGIRTMKYAPRTDEGGYGKVETMPYAKGISFDPQVEEEPVYANDRKIMAILSDQGYTGNIDTTAPDPAFEEALGQTMQFNGATADMKMDSYKRMAIYYELTQKLENGTSYVVKVWALNAEIGKASKSHATDQNTPTLGEYQYPFTVYGEELKAADGKAYTDENGNTKSVTRIIAVPSDTNYDKFGDAVPSLTMTTGAAQQENEEENEEE